MAMAVSPGRAAGVGCGRRVFFSDPRYFRSVSVKVSASPNGSSTSGIRGGETRRERKSVESAKKSLPPEAMTFSSSISTELPIIESPEASFDDYLEDMPRIFRAMFPDTRRSRQLNEEEWRVQMLPIEFLFASVNPVVVMRLRSRPLAAQEAHPNLSRALDLRVIRWELRGLEGAYSPPHFELDVRGLLYADRSGRARLRGRLQMGISLVLPPVFSLVPEPVLRGVADSVLRTLLEKMRDDVNGNLLSDFQRFRREKMKEMQLLKMQQSP